MCRCFSLICVIYVGSFGLPYVDLEDTRMRDRMAERSLQKALDDGHHVWVIGDVHGFNQTRLALMESLDLQPKDWVVFLGDLIDRGPNAFGVVHDVRTDAQMVSVKGNHEAMMVQQFHAEKIARPDMDVMLWMRNGGDATLSSYLNAFRNENDVIDEQAMYAHVEVDRLWMSRLPSHLVLDRWCLVHAGYRPGVGLDEQDEADLLWIRGAFHRARTPIDEQRTVVFGHTPTAGLPGFTARDWGQPWHSDLVLEDGRAAAIGIDTCVYHGQEGPMVMTAFNLQTGTFVKQQRIEP